MRRLIFLALAWTSVVGAESNNLYVGREPGGLGGWATVEVVERLSEIWTVRFLDGPYAGRLDKAYHNALSIKSGCYDGFCVGQRVLYRKRSWLVDLMAYHQEREQWLARLVYNDRYLDGFYSGYEFKVIGSYPECEGSMVNFTNQID